ncbi:MAG: GtrA family protein [Burkholderiales bacterium]
MRITKPRQFLRYAGTGAVGTAAHYATLFALVQPRWAEPVAASTAGFVAGALVNYGLNHRYTFASQRAHRHALPRFAAVALLGLFVNAAVLALVLAVAGPHYMIAQVVATGVVLVVGYQANRLWTF